MRDLSELTTKMKANLERFRGGDHPPGGNPVLHVGAAEHLVSRGLIVKAPGAGFGRARAAYILTAKGTRALAKL